jgi:hypothetical protein
MTATTESELSITTPDGECDGYFVHPTNGAAPGVLIWPDIFGLRPAFRQVGKRRAESGYSVLVVNPFCRTKKAPTSSPHADFEDPSTQEALMALPHSLTPKTAITDAKARTAWLDRQPSVDRSRKMATTGYCMSQHASKCTKERCAGDVRPILAYTTAMRRRRHGASCSCCSNVRSGSIRREDHMADAARSNRKRVATITPRRDDRNVVHAAVNSGSRS